MVDSGRCGEKGALQSSWWQTVRVMDRVAMRCEPAASVGSNGREMVG